MRPPPGWSPIIREVRPRVMVSYDDSGFYGHPDHIQAHRVAWRAYQLAAGSAARWPGCYRPRRCPGRCWPARSG